MSTVLGSARQALNSVLHTVGLEVVRVNTDHHWDDPREFLPFQATLAGAAQAGMTVSDYVETQHNRLGATQETIDQMAALGVFSDPITNVCEIGPGSGRYLERTLKACRPSHYEIYETASEWAEWLSRTYGVVFRPTDGKTLASTPSESIDLAQAHKVFVATPSLTTCRYLIEMARVVRSAGKVVFDVMTEDCLDGPTLDAWFADGPQSGPYPALMPRQYVIDLLSDRDFVLRGSFFVDMRPGKTECMVFARVS